MENSLEAEQELIVHKLGKEMDRLRMQRHQLAKQKAEVEAQVGKDREYLQNELQARVERLGAEKEGLQREKRQLRSQVASLSASVSQLCREKVEMEMSMEMEEEGIVNRMTRQIDFLVRHTRRLEVKLEALGARDDMSVSGSEREMPPSVSSLSSSFAGLGGGGLGGASSGLSHVHLKDLHVPSVVAGAGWACSPPGRGFHGQGGARSNTEGALLASLGAQPGVAMAGGASLYHAAESLGRRSCAAGSSPYGPTPVGSRHGAGTPSQPASPAVDPGRRHQSMDYAPPSGLHGARPGEPSRHTRAVLASANAAVPGSVSSVPVTPKKSAQTARPAQATSGVEVPPLPVGGLGVRGTPPRPPRGVDTSREVRSEAHSPTYSADKRGSRDPGKELTGEELGLSIARTMHAMDPGATRPGTSSTLADARPPAMDP